MQGGDADEFIDFMNDGDASVRHKSYVYRFSGLKFHPGRDTNSISVEKYRFTASLSKSSWKWCTTTKVTTRKMC